MSSQIKLDDLNELEDLRKQAEKAGYRQAAAQRQAMQRYADHLVFWGEELISLARPLLTKSDCPECEGRGYLWYVAKDEDPMDGARQHKCEKCHGTGQRRKEKA